MSQALGTKEEVLQIIREKQAALPAILEEEGFDCWIIFVRETASNPDPIFGLTVGGDVVWVSAFVYALVEGKLQTVAIVGNFDADSERSKQIWDRVLGYKEGISQELQAVLTEFQPTSIALNFSETDVVADGLSHGLYIQLCKILPTFQDKFHSAAPIIRKLRGRKTPTELGLIRHACQITADINQKVTASLRVGLSETDVQAKFYQLMEEHGVHEAWQRDSCPAVDAGPDKVFGHLGPVATEACKAGHTLHNDFGVRYHGYCSDIQRMWFFGSPEAIPEELHYAFETVKGAIERAADFVKPGVRGFEVDQIARAYVVERGFEEYGHALGHQVGTEAHDGGVLLGPKWERYGDIVTGVVEVDNVFTLELHVVTQHFGTVSLEEMIVVTPGGCEFFLPPQQEFWCVS